jgi:GxxExxY protein
LEVRKLDNYNYSDITGEIIAAAYRVHKELGHGFLEKVYRNALAIELGESGLNYAVEVPLKVLYRGKLVGEYFADLIVDNKIIVEAKAVSKLDSAHEVQLVNYLKATGMRIGLLINFGQTVEVKRRIFGYDTTDEN